MTIGRICNREVISAARDTTVQAAAKLMRHFQQMAEMGRILGREREHEIQDRR